MHSSGVAGDFFSGAQAAKTTPAKTGGDGGVALEERPPEQKQVSRARPYLVIAGLVVSFSLVTLFGSLLLSVLGLPQDVLRWAGLVVLVLIGVGLIVPRFEYLLERPFSWIPQRNPDASRGGFALGLALGAVYVPCAGPILAAITVAGSTGEIGRETVVLTLTFAFGAALPLLLFALAGRRVAERVKAFRKRQRGIRITGGVVMIALAVGLVFNLPQLLQRVLPDYTAPIAERVNNSDEVREALDLGGLENDQNKDLDKCEVGARELESCGTAPDIKNIQQWFNTPGNEAVTLDQFRGKVVLLDFWAYSCINCQRSLPHVTAWNEAYEDAGLHVIGIHAPEYAFEKEARNVESAAEDFGITYPVALDNSLSTWTNYRNRYWPAPEPTDTTDTTPDGEDITRETFLGATKRVNFGGTETYSGGEKSFALPADQKKDRFALDGDWTLTSQNITPTAGDGQIRLNYRAKEVRIVLSGSGTVTYEAGGETQTITVAGTPNSYQLLSTPDLSQGTVTVTVGPGVSAYSFTFG